jgi:4-amino-4-deoxy-L-arabinose transferase-like glycosyltransferase
MTVAPAAASGPGSDRGAAAGVPLLVAALAAALLALGVFRVGSGSRGLWNPDEPREAEICREMWATGDLVAPRINGQPFVEKPPLYAWLTCAVFLLRGGPDVLGARLVASLAGALLVALTVWFAGRWLTEPRPWTAGLALLSMPLFWWHASRANLDIPLALLVSASIAGLFSAYMRAGRDRVARVWGADVALAAVAMGLGFLTKGLVGIVLPAVVGIAFLVLEGNLRFLLRVPWMRFLALVAVLVMPWLVLFALRDGGRLAHDFLVVHHLRRYAHGFDHLRPAWHYLWTLPLSTFPWSLLLPLALVSTLSRWRAPEGPALRLAWAWLAAIVLFFTASASKRDLYLLPAFPAVALLASLALRGLSAPEDGEDVAAVAPRTRTATCAVTAVAMVAFAVPLAIPGLLDRIHVPPGFIEELNRNSVPLCLAGGSLVLAGFGAALLGYGPHPTARAVFAIPALVCALITLGWILPALDRLKSGREVCRALAADVPVVGWALAEGDLGVFLFARGKPIAPAPTPEAVRDALLAGTRVLGEDKLLSPVLRRLPVRTRVVARAPVGASTFILVERLAPGRGPGASPDDGGGATGPDRRWHDTAGERPRRHEARTRQAHVARPLPVIPDARPIDGIDLDDVTALPDHQSSNI